MNHIKSKYKLITYSFAILFLALFMICAKSKAIDDDLRRNEHLIKKTTSYPGIYVTEFEFSK